MKIAKPRVQEVAIQLSTALYEVLKNFGLKVGKLKEHHYGDGYTLEFSVPMDHQYVANIINQHTERMRVEFDMPELGEYALRCKAEQFMMGTSVLVAPGEKVKPGHGGINMGDAAAVAEDRAHTIKSHIQDTHGLGARKHPACTVRVFVSL